MIQTVQECPIERSELAIDMTGTERTYVGANFSGRIPHSDNLDITRNKRLALPLLPVKDKPGISVTGNKFWKSSKGSNDFSIFDRLIVSEDLQNTIGRSCHEERLVILVDVPDFVDL